MSDKPCPACDPMPWQGRHEDACLIADLERQLAESEAGAAAMREALEDCWPEHPYTCAAWGNPSKGPCDCGADEARVGIKKALASDAGRVFLERLADEVARREKAENEWRRFGWLKDEAVKEARAQALEDAAKVAEENGTHYPLDFWPEDSQHPEARVAAGCRLSSRNIAAAIRLLAKERKESP